MAEGLERYLMGELECPVCLLISSPERARLEPALHVLDTLFVKTVK